MSCSNCGPDPCQCSSAVNSRHVYHPSTTVERACELIHMLVQSKGCSVSCPDNDLCKMLQFECDLCGGKYPIAALAMMVAARLLESEALGFARRGNVKTLTVSFNGNQSASEISAIAKTWREQAEQCVPKQRFAVVAMSQGCLAATKSVYKSCGCPAKILHTDTVAVSSCEFDCCYDCED